MSEPGGASLGSALAMLWQRHRQTNLDRITLLEETTAAVLRGSATAEQLEEGTKAAHKLAGSLGTFGFDAGSRAALEAESLLRLPPPIDAKALAEAVTALRAAVEEVGTEPGAKQQAAADELPPDGIQVRVISSDPELVSRLTVEGAAVGLGVAALGSIPTLHAARAAGLAAVLIDDDGHAERPWPTIVDAVGDLAVDRAVVVLTDRESFDDRLELARVGAAGVLARTRTARQTIAFLDEALARRRSADATVLALHTDAFAVELLGAAIDGSSVGLRVCADPGTFWESLEEHGADLVVLDTDLPGLEVTDLCRLLRAHPRWYRLPLVALGGRSTKAAKEALEAGADDHLGVRTPAAELALRLRTHLERARLAEQRADIDPLTGANNRGATERSLDRLLRLAHRRDEPLAVARVSIEGLEQITENEGAAMAEIVLRRLAGRLLAEFSGQHDVVGRWSADGFVVGLLGESRESAGERVEAVLDGFATEGFRTTSGDLAHFGFRAGVAAYPTDGTTIASLDKVSEAALRRAQHGRDRIVTSAERETGGGSVLDVVLVEDDDSVADVVAHALGLRNHDFRRFSDGAEAANALAARQVRGRIILLDVGLPSLDGFGVLQLLRDQGVLEESHVIMLTARSTETEMLRALGLGATEHITKPFSVPVLLGRIRQTLARRAA